MLSLGSSQNCQFILSNGTGTDSVVCVRMNITAEFKIGYNKTVDQNTTEVYIRIYMYVCYTCSLAWPDLRGKMRGAGDIHIYIFVLAATIFAGQSDRRKTVMWSLWNVIIVYRQVRYRKWPLCLSTPWPMFYTSVYLYYD